MKKLSFRGDTIIEVLISITVVSVVLGGAYASANRSLSATRQAQERGESLKLAEEQLERLKSLSKLQPAIFTDTDRFFCIKEDLTYIKYESVSDLRDFAAYDECEQRPQEGVSYYLIIERTNSSTFVVHSNWYQANGQGYDKLELVYRLYPGSVTLTPPPSCSDPSAAGCGGGAAGPNPAEPRVRLSARPSTVNRGARTNIEWSIANGTFDRCEASNSAGSVHRNWNGTLDAKDVARGGGSERTGRMNEDGGDSTVFIIECWKGSYKDMDSVTVSVTDQGSPSGPSGPSGGSPPTPGGPGDVCGVSTYFAHPGPIGHGHDGEDGIGGNAEDGLGGDACTGDQGDGGDGGDSADGGDGRPSAPSAPSAPGGPATGTVCTKKNGKEVCTEI